MDIFEAIGTKLLATTAITTVVGTKVYHALRPAGSAPCINFFEAGYVALHNGVVEAPRYQISCRATTPKVAQNLAREVITTFHNFQGTVSGFDIQRVSVESKLLLPEPDTKLYHVPVDIRFVYNESTVS